ncbi:MAG: nucleotidyltransferase domain-containing protein [Nanoarchaeota archaeon]|nr:nucleotidyltransferase domain-containing protein [Nanoarchaeota archaeon]
MAQSINSLLKEIIEGICPPKEDVEFIETELKKFLRDIEEKIKGLGVGAEMFVGGSFAKNTMIKKDHYDIDLFLRYDKKYEDEELTKISHDIIEGAKDFEIVHGSRDYFKVKIRDDVFFEIVPVQKVKNPKDAENITDLSFSHVRYINKKMKKPDLDQVRLAKAFCYANHCYGAESYIGGFSGYALELLICKYKTFVKFLRAMSKVKEKLVIDIEKHHKSAKAVMMDINEAKLTSPIILIDPTFKHRNALAALSYETFEKFKKEAAAFLKKPEKKAFEVKKTDLEKIKEDAGKNNHEFVLIEANTDKQEGDIAGSKLLKFFRHLEEEITTYFEIKEKGFNYNKDKSARYFVVAESKGELILEGPSVTDEENVLNFRKKHENIFTSNNKMYAREKVDFDLKGFILDWKKKNSLKMEEMHIKILEIID